MTRYTRIILINDREQGIREFTISHRMVWLLGVLGVLLAALLAWTLVAYGVAVRRAARVPGLEAEALAARAEMNRVAALQAELEEMRGLQERLLLMLGVSAGAGADSLAGARPAAEMQRLAAQVLTPPPDAWPAAGYLTQGFQEGAAERGILPHPGLDIAGPEGAPILAAGDGTVARIGTDSFLGNFVEIQHGLGYLTVYGHCQRVAVAQGERVRRGQVVAYLGATGEASAPHLHFEIWHDGLAVDPRRFLSGDPPSP